MKLCGLNLNLFPCSNIDEDLRWYYVDWWGNFYKYTGSECRPLMLQSADRNIIVDGETYYKNAIFVLCKRHELFWVETGYTDANTAANTAVPSAPVKNTGTWRIAKMESATKFEYIMDTFTCEDDGLKALEELAKNNFGETFVLVKVVKSATVQLVLK